LLIQRDIRDLARISALEALPRLLALAAGQTACLVNISELAAPFQMSRPTIREYVTLLSRIFLLEELPPWHGNRMKRLIKTPKLHLGDTGLRKLQDAVQGRFASGVVLYDGGSVVPFGNNLYAVPISCLWQTN